VAWQVLRHDEKSNKNYWRNSTIEDFIKVAEDAMLRVQGYYIS
jgi:hypothetical protein